jgi:23S rRNA pseudouridine2605 synthase
VEGRVQVNGKVVTTLGSKADAGRDHIRVDGKLLHGAERLRYFVLNKPRGYVTTVSDPEGRPTVMEFFSKMGERLYPVGRLDYLSEGLLLMTNDGELANKLTRAASGVEKTYLVKVSGQPDEDLIDQIRQGISIDKGRPGEGRVTTAPAHIRLVRVGENPWYEVGLIEGRNRELRKMFEEIGHHVEKIRRIGYGPLVLDQEPGNFRELDAEELKVLRLAAEGKWKPKRVKTTAMLPPHSGRTADRQSRRPEGKPFRSRDDRPPQRPAATGERREDSRPSYGRTQERGNFERPARPQQGGFARREQPPRAEYPPREGGFADRRGAGSRPRREFPPRPPADSDRGARGGNAPRSGTFGAQARPGGFPARREGGSGEGGFRPAAPREAGFKDRRQGGFDAKRAGAAGNLFAGPRGAGKPAENRGAARPFESRGGGQDRPRFSSGGERRQGGQGDRFRPRPSGSGEGGFAPRPGGRTREQGSERAGERGGQRQSGGRPQGRPAFGRGNFGGPPRGAGAGPRGAASRPTGSGQGRSGESRGGQANTGEFRGGPPRTGSAGAARPSGPRPSGPRPSGSRPSSAGRPGGGQFKRTGSAGGPPRGPSGGGGSRRPPSGPRRGSPSQGRSNSSRGNSGRKPGSRPPR